MMKIVYSLFIFVVILFFFVITHSPKNKEELPSVVTILELERKLKDTCEFGSAVIGQICIFPVKIPNKLIKEGWIEARGQLLTDYPKLKEVLNYPSSPFCKKNVCHNPDFRSGFSRNGETEIFKRQFIVYAIKAK